jgi:hypothetical protein
MVGPTLTHVRVFRRPQLCATAAFDNQPVRHPYSPVPTFSLFGLVVPLYADPMGPELLSFSSVHLVALLKGNLLTRGVFLRIRLVATGRHRLLCSAWSFVVRVPARGHPSSPCEFACDLLLNNEAPCSPRRYIVRHPPAIGLPHLSVSSVGKVDGCLDDHPGARHAPLLHSGVLSIIQLRPP